jgi:tRNA U34 5-methylaminomethyl-2-thiouridine-forming methyltransferase MnmC
MQTTIQQTEDGSHTLYVPAIDERYHSTHGAVQESMHIFIDAGLRACKKERVNILEIGFGTGLNVYLTLLEAEKNGKRIHYTSLELYPLTKDVFLRLNYPDMLHESKQLFRTLHRAAWNVETDITPTFVLKKIAADFTKYRFSGTFDLVFFDAFSPEKQPEMWAEEHFRKIYAHSSPDAILTTYCAKGAVRRTLQSVGFEVERLQGPAGKREMLRGRKSTD